ncbi:MAG: hypothetical protein JNJ85_15355 [Candidatus Kapabacteria bacterium]|nr:hypothetical protein [Candidatus Kapabacteria bacterium]
MLMQIPAGYISESIFTDSNSFSLNNGMSEFIDPNIYEYLYPDSSTILIRFESGIVFLEDFPQDTLHYKLYKDIVIKRYDDGSNPGEMIVGSNPDIYQYLKSEDLTCVNNTYFHSGYCQMDTNGRLPSYYYKIAFDCKQKLCRYSVSYKCKTFSQKIIFDNALRSIIWFR